MVLKRKKGIRNIQLSLKKLARIETGIFFPQRILMVKIVKPVIICRYRGILLQLQFQFQAFVHLELFQEQEGL